MSYPQPSLEDIAVLDEMFHQTHALRNVEECCQFYDGDRFQVVLESLTLAQGVLHSREARAEWSWFWALELSYDTAHSWFLNYCRKTALKLFYKVCDLALAWSNNNEMQACEHIVEIFQHNRLGGILTTCVPMDRANCLYNMINTYTNERGLYWYSEEHQENQALLFENPTGPTMNKRLMMVQRYIFANDGFYEYFLATAEPTPPPPRSREIPVVSDDESLPDEGDNHLQNSIFQSMPRNLSVVDTASLDGMRNQIDALQTLKKCNQYYDGFFFQEVLRRLRQPQQEYLDNHSNVPHYSARNEWSELWALELSHGREHLQSYLLKYCCGTALALLYKVCDLALAQSGGDKDAACALIRETFEERRLDQILTHCLPMERARYLYHEIRFIATGERGLGWYSEEQAGDRDWGFLFENPRGPTIDNRLVMVQERIFPNDENYESWLEQAFPP